MRVLDVHLERDRLVAELRRRDGRVWRASAPLAGAEDVGATLGVLGSLPPLRGTIRRLRVTLGPSLVQRRTLRDLPPVRAGELEALVATQQARFFRRNGTPLATAARWEAPGTGMRAAAAAAIETVWLEALAAGAESVGWRLEAVRSASEGWSLLPSRELAARAARTRRRAVRLVGLGAAAWLAAAALYAGRLHATDRRLAAAADSLAAPVAAVRRARLALHAADAMIARVDAARTAGLAAGAVLERLVRALPDSAAIAELELQTDGRGRVTVVATDIDAVVARWRAAPGVPAAALEAPAAPLDGGTRERGTIRLGAGEAAR